MREARNWEDLDSDCLANILGRVGIESLLMDVPFVCKSWYKATFNPLCWHHLHISPASVFKHGSCDTPFVHRFVQEFRIKNFSIGGFISLVFRRGLGKSPSRVLTENCGPVDLEFVADKCPELKSISLNSYVLENYHLDVTNVLGLLKELDELEIVLDMGVNFDDIVTVIGQNCKKFSSLIVSGECFGGNDALAIPDHLPKIKKLSVNSHYLDEKGMEDIIRRCRDLEYLDVSSTWLWEEEEKEKIKELASHIKTFKLK